MLTSMSKNQSQIQVYTGWWGVCAGDEVNDALFLSSASQKEI